MKDILISLNLPDTESVLTVKNGGKVLPNFYILLKLYCTFLLKLSAQQCIDMFAHFGELFKGKISWVVIIYCVHNYRAPHKREGIISPRRHLFR